MIEESRLKISGIVVCFNEDLHLDDCLKRLRFCDELIVIDLGSTDKSLLIAQAHGARIVTHPWVPIVEQVRSFAVQQAKNDWIVFMDPDLMFPEDGEKIIIEEITKSPTIGIIYIKYQNYYIGKPLRFGRWGGKRGYPAVLNRRRVIFSSDVHRGIELKPPYISRNPDTKNDIIVHYWADSKEHLLRKSKRYLEKEGEARYNKGERTSRNKIITRTIKTLIYSAFIKGGFLDGATGIYLSYLAGWYEWNAQYSLLIYQRQSEKSMSVII